MPGSSPARDRGRALRSGAVAPAPRPSVFRRRGLAERQAEALVYFVQGQRRGVRHGLRRQALCPVPAPARATQELPGHGHRPGHRAAHHRPPRGARVGRGGGRSGRNLLLHPGGACEHQNDPVGRRQSRRRGADARALKEGNIPNEIVVAHDGVEASTTLFGTGLMPAATCRVSPQLILLDFKLPKLGGLQVLERLRTDPRPS